MPIEEAALARAREAHAAYLTGTARILRYSAEKDNYGGRTASYSEDTEHPCLVQRKEEPIETTRGDRTRAVSDWDVLLPWDTVVTTADRILVGEVTYEILGTNVHVTNRLLLVVDARKV